MPARSLRSLITAAALALASPPLLTPSWAAEAINVVNVRLDEAKIVDLPETTSTVVVGNPMVVDATMLKGNRKMVLTGKGFGETNFIALDKNGQVTGESVIKVAGSGKNFIVQKGANRESYHCDTRCEPTVSLGDGSAFLSQSASDIAARNAAQTGGSTPGR